MNSTFNNSSEQYQAIFLTAKVEVKWFMQQQNDPKHTSKSAREWIKKKKLSVLELLNQSLGLKAIEVQQFHQNILECYQIKTIHHGGIGRNSYTAI